MEGGTKEAEEGAVVVAARALRRHPPMDAKDDVDGPVRAALRCHLHRHLLILLPPPLNA
jgi:hypothetical protein